MDKVYVIMTGLGPRGVFESFVDAINYAVGKGWIKGSRYGELEDASVIEVDFHPYLKEV